MVAKNKQGISRLAFKEQQLRSRLKHLEQLKIETAKLALELGLKTPGQKVKEEMIVVQKLADKINIEINLKQKELLLIEEKLQELRDKKKTKKYLLGSIGIFMLLLLISVPQLFDQNESWFNSGIAGAVSGTDGLKITENMANGTVEVLLLRGAGGDADLGTSANITWAIEDQKNSDIFTHSTVTNTDLVTILTDGIYRISYGLTVEQQGSCNGNDVKKHHAYTSNILINGLESGLCFASDFSRGISSDLQSTATGECLLNLSAGESIKLSSIKTTQDSCNTPTYNSTDSWMHIKKVQSPNTIILLDSVGGDNFATELGSVSPDYDVVLANGSAFDFATNSNEVQVLEDGLYKVSYSVGFSTSTAIREGTISEISIKPNGGVYSKANLGTSGAMIVGERGNNNAVVGTSTILNLSALDTIKLNITSITDTQSAILTTTGGRISLELEYLGNSGLVNAISVYDIGGHNDLSTPPFNFSYDTINAIGDDFEFSNDERNITVLRNGFYHITYGVTSFDHNGSVLDTFDHTLQINGVRNETCRSHHYSIGVPPLPDLNGIRQAAASASCIIELTTGDMLSVQNDEQTIGSDVIPTKPGAVWLSLESLSYLELLPPAVDNLRPINESIYTDGQIVEIGANITDINNPIDTAAINISLANGSIEELTLNFESINWYTINYTAPALPGEYTIVFIANDSLGNINSTESTTFNVSDVNVAPSAPTIIGPLNNSATANRSVNIQWNNSIDDTNDSLTYNLVISTDVEFTTEFLNIAGIENSTGDNTTFSVTNDFDIDLTYYIKVRSFDSVKYSEWSNVSQFDTLSLISIDMPVSNVNFGSLGPRLSLNTTDPSYPPFEIINDGNVPVNLLINATAFFNSTNSEIPGNYSFMIEDKEAGSYTSAFTDWTNMTETTQQGVTSMYYQNSTEINNEVYLHLYILIPSEEKPGVKQSDVTVEAEIS